MSVLNKLLGMLDELKEENPELANKALLAAETLKSGLDSESAEEQWEKDEEEFDDSYVVVEEADTKSFFNNRDLLNSKLSEYGIYMRDHEVQKLLKLEEIENVRSNNEKFVQELREKYSLDPNAGYTLELDEQGSGNLAFVKQ